MIVVVVVINIVIETSPQKRAENGKLAGSERSRPLNRRLADRSETRRPLAIERRLEHASTACWTDKVGGV